MLRPWSSAAGGWLRGRIAYPPNSLVKGSTSIPLASCPGLWGGFQRTVSFRFLLVPSPCACRTGVAIYLLQLQNAERPFRITSIP